MMTYILGGILILCFTQQAVAMTTMAPSGNNTHHHHENPETDSLMFTYDGQTQMLLVHTGDKCYIWTLTHKELHNVHTDDGLRQIELRVLNEIDQSFYTVIDKRILSPSITHGCGKDVTSYYVVH